MAEISIEQLNHLEELSELEFSEDEKNIILETINETAIAKKNIKDGINKQYNPILTILKSKDCSLLSFGFLNPKIFILKPLNY